MVSTLNLMPACRGKSLRKQRQIIIAPASNHVLYAQEFRKATTGARGTTRHSSVPPAGAPKLKQTQTIPLSAAPWSSRPTTQTPIRVEIPYRTRMALTPDSLVLSSGSLLLDNTDSRADAGLVQTNSQKLSASYAGDVPARSSTRRLDRQESPEGR